MLVSWPRSLVVRPVFYWMSVSSVAEDVRFLWPTDYSLRLNGEEKPLYGSVVFPCGLVIIKWKIVAAELLCTVVNRRSVALAELISVSVQSIPALVRVSEGDLRKAITFLQSAARLSIDKEISERTITEIAGVSQRSCVKHGADFPCYCPFTLLLCQVVPDRMIDSLLHVCFRGTFEKLEVEVRVCVVLGFVSASSDEWFHSKHVLPPVFGSFDRTWWMKDTQPLRSWVSSMSPS